MEIMVSFERPRKAEFPLVSLVLVSLVLVSFIRMSARSHGRVSSFVSAVNNKAARLETSEM